jgi:hypothetical protein
VKLGRKLPIWILLTMISIFAGVRCAGDPSTTDRPDGFILISLSGLRADALGYQGTFQPSPSPFLDALAARAAVYTLALTPSPDTLVAHVSLLSGLYPAEHRVVPPAGTLAPGITVLPERFAEYGFRTAGFTSGGYLSSDFGFDRGFDRFDENAIGSKLSLDRAVGFLKTVGDDPFFVFLHSDAIEEALAEVTADGGVAGQEPYAMDFGRLVGGNDQLTVAGSTRVETAYREAVADLDRELASLFEEIEALGLPDRTVVAITADHGFEFGEHGSFGHAQVYPETLGVPLVIVGPGVAAKRITALAQTVDVAPSLYALAGLPAPRRSGRILPGLRGPVEPVEPRRWATAEVRGRWQQESLFLEVEGRLYQSVESRLRGEHDGTWVTRQVTFDTLADRLEFSIVSFLEGRTVRVALEGQMLTELEIDSRWATKSLSLPQKSSRKRMSLGAADCKSPIDVGAGPDRRCLSFKLRGQELSRFELFDLGADPGARFDISRERPDLVARLRAGSARHRWETADAPEVTKPRAATLATILARAEYPEPPRP